jgi:hypothetical protein
VTKERFFVLIEVETDGTVDRDELGGALQDYWCDDAPVIDFTIEDIGLHVTGEVQGVSTMRPEAGRF